MVRGKVVVRILGGLGNQLFAYAFARALAARNDAELVLDTRTGFVRDFYKRGYSLQHFAITAREATRAEALDFRGGRYARAALRAVSQRLPVALRPYLYEDTTRYDPRRIARGVHGVTYVDGNFQCEAYFRAIAPALRDELRIVTPLSDETRRMADGMDRGTPVCLHTRRLHAVPAGKDARPDPARSPSLPREWYLRAVERIVAAVPDAHFYCFADYPDWAREHLAMPHPITFVTHNTGDERSFEDLYLMTRCRHHIIANSTFSWWGAWLAEHPGQRVIAPRMSAYWLPDDLVPARWTILE